MLLVVTSNNLMRGLIPTDDMPEKIIKKEEKSITVKFYNYNYKLKKPELFTVSNNCTVNERFIFTGNAGSIWFKLNFPLSYIRNIYGENLYKGGQRAINKCLKEYSKSKPGDVLDDAINPMEFYFIIRSKDGNSLEVYSIYRFGIKEYSYLSPKYKDMFMKYYDDNINLLSRFAPRIDDHNMDNLAKTNDCWIKKDDPIDIFPNGGWYILKSTLGDGKEKYYFGKADDMSRRIKWQKSKIGHPQNNAYKLEPLFDCYNAWYFSFDKLDCIYKDGENIYINLLNMITILLKKIVGYISKDMGCPIIIDDINTCIKENNAEEKTDIEKFFDLYISMITSNTIDIDGKSEKGKPHYVFNSYCTSWKIKKSKEEDIIGKGMGLLMTKCNGSYKLIPTSSLYDSISELGDDVYYRYIKLDFSRMNQDYKTERSKADIHAGFLYGVEGLVNDILRFLARDLDIAYYNDAFDSASNTAYNYMIGDDN